LWFAPEFGGLRAKGHLLSRSIVAAGRMWRPWNVLQYLPRHAWQLAMFTAIRNASSLVSSFATDVLLPRKSGSVRLGRTHKGQKAATSF
jgi:hypothetical protein